MVRDVRVFVLGLEAVPEPPEGLPFVWFRGYCTCLAAGLGRPASVAAVLVVEATKGGRVAVEDMFTIPEQVSGWCTKSARPLLYNPSLWSAEQSWDVPWPAVGVWHCCPTFFNLCRQHSAGKVQQPHAQIDWIRSIGIQSAPL